MTMHDDASRVNAMIEKVLADIGAVFHAPLMLIGEKLGLFRTLADIGPASPPELAAASTTAARYVAEWLPAMAAGWYVHYDAATGRYSLTEAQRLVLADAQSPCYLGGAFQAATAAIRSEAKVAQGFATGEGVCWSEHDPEFYHASDRFYRPNYAANLVQSWIPALAGVVDKLEVGCRVADVGCGHGSSTILMAHAFPRSTFVGIDFHAPSIDACRQAAARERVADRVSFEVCRAEQMQLRGLDLVTMFDCLHDMGDPQGAAARVLQALQPDGTWMIVEPFAGEHVEDNFTPIGRLFYCASVLLCVPGSLAQDTGAALGSQAGEARIRQLVCGAGFSRFRRVAETPINIVYEARP